MRNFISEDDIEQAILQKLKAEPFRYEIVRCDPSPSRQEALPDGTGRSSKKECMLPQVLGDPADCEVIALILHAGPVIVDELAFEYRHQGMVAQTSLHHALTDHG